MGTWMDEHRKNGMAWQKHGSMTVWKHGSLCHVSFAAWTARIAWHGVAWHGMGGIRCISSTSSSSIVTLWTRTQHVHAHDPFPRNINGAHKAVTGLDARF